MTIRIMKMITTIMILIMTTIIIMMIMTMAATHRPPVAADHLHRH